MPHQVHWGNAERTLILTVYAEPLTVEDFIASQDDNLKLLDEVDHRVDSIVDMTAVQRLPPQGIAALPRLGNHPAISHRNVGRVTVVMGNGILETLSRIFARVYRPFHSARTVAQAYEILGLPPPD